METTIPDNGVYLIFGLVMTALIMGAFFASMTMRYRNLQKDMMMLDELGDNE